MSETAYDVAVLGAGVTGLVTAWKLSQSGIRTVVIEKQGRPGGVIGSQRLGDWLIDCGPNSLSFKAGEPANQILDELGLEDQVQSRPIAESDRFIWRDNALRKVPSTPWQLFKGSAVSRMTLIHAVAGVFRNHELKSDVSVGDFFCRVFGQKAVEQVLTPAIAGIYATDPFSLSMESVMPSVYNAVKKSGSLAGAMRKLKQKTNSQTYGPRVLCSFHDGMEVLPKRLAKAITDNHGSIQLNSVVTHLSRDAQGIYQIKTGSSTDFTARQVVCTVPAMAAGSLLEQIAAKVATQLQCLRYASLVVVHLGVRSSDITGDPSGFGYLAARNQGLRSLGMIWNDQIFSGRAPNGHRLFTVFVGGQLDPAAITLPDSELVDVVLADLRRAMKWKGSKPEILRITRWQNALPIFEVGHATRLRTILSELPEDLYLSGNYVTGVSIPNCMQRAAELSDRIARRNGAQDPVEMWQ